MNRGFNEVGRRFSFTLDHRGIPRRPSPAWAAALCAPRGESSDKVISCQAGGQSTQRLCCSLLCCPLVFQPVLQSAEQVVEIDELEDVTDMVDLALHASGLTGSEKQLRGLPC